MPSRMKYESHANFGGGMFRDFPRHLIPENGVYDASNVIVTNNGSLSKRGASQSAIDNLNWFAPTHVGAQQSSQIDGRKRLYVVGERDGDLRFGSLFLADTEQELFEFQSSIDADQVSIPTRFGDSVIFPVRGSGVLAWCGGADFDETDANYAATGLTISTTANDNEITIGSTPANNVFQGGYIHLADGGTEEYTGRILSVGSSSVTVHPPPTRAGTFTTLNYYPVLPQVGTLSDGEYLVGCGAVGAFASGADSRIVVGNVKVNVGGKTVQRPNRVMWSVSEASDRTVNNVDGLIQATRAGFPKRNFIDIEDIDQIIALVPIGSNNMLVLGSNKSVMLSGFLVTEADETQDSKARGGSTVSVRQFAQTVGCLSAGSVQQTSSGVMFASLDGIYITDGSAMVNVTERKIASYYLGDVSVVNPITFGTSTFNGTAFFDSYAAARTIIGSANVSDEYYVLSTEFDTFVCNLLSNFAWTRIPAGQLAIGGSAQDPTLGSGRVYAIKPNIIIDFDPSYFDIDEFDSGEFGGAQFKDNVIRIDPVFNSDPTGTQDADGNEFEARIETRTYTEGDPAQLRRFRHVLVTFQMDTGSSGDFAFSETPGLDASGVSTAVSAPTVTADTFTVRRYDIQMISQGVTYTFQTENTPNAFTLLQLTNGFNNLRAGRVR